MAGKKKHRLRKQQQKDPDQEYSSGENSEQNCLVRACPHLVKSVNLQAIKKVLKSNLNLKKCQLCSAVESVIKEGVSEDIEEPALWLCLQCGNLGCGRYSDGKHAIAHYQTPRSDCHALSLNLTSWGVWCYDCDEDIMPDSNKKLLECIEFLRKQMIKPSSTKIIPVPVADNHQSPNSCLIASITPIISINEESSKENGGKVSAERSKELQKLGINSVSVENLPKVKGLVNLGNTCFFNAVMQSLSQTHVLSVLIDCQCINDITLTLEKNGPGVEATDIVEPLNISLSEVGQLTKALSAFFKEMDSKGRSSRTVNPGNLFGQVCKKAPQFRGMMQQDSHELLRHLLDGLKNEEIKRCQTGILKAFGLFGISNAQKVDTSTRASLKSYSKLVQTLVDQVFSGKLISTVLCEECKMSSQVFEPFLDLSLPVMEEKPIRPNISKKSFSNELPDGTFLERVVEKPSKYQEKKAKKQAKRDAKAQRNKAKQQRRRTISIGEPLSDVNASPVHEGVPKVKIEVDTESTNNSVETKNDSELSDADVEDNEESESISSLNMNAPAIVGGKKLVDDDCWPCPEELPFHESRPEVDELCLKVKGLQVRQDSLPDTNGIVADKGTRIKEEDEADDQCQEENSWNNYNGDITNGHHMHSQKMNKSDDDDKMWSSSDEDEVKNERKLAGHLSAKKEWVNKSMTTLSPRYQVSSHECSVLSCLNQFTGLELLTGNNKFGCNNCTRLRDEEQGVSKEEKSSKNKKTTVYTNASKQLLVFSPPAILTLHLKRFQQVGFSLRKVNRHIDFPLTLDLAPYCSLVCLGLPTLKKGQQRVLYSLYAVVEHSGRLSGGHYTAYVKVRQPRNTAKEFLNKWPTSSECDIGQLMDKVHDKLSEEVSIAANGEEKASSESIGQWYHVSDGHVSESSETSVLKCQAYLLFYERIV